MLRIEKASVTDIPLIQELTMKVWPQTYTPIIGAKQVEYMLAQFYTDASLQMQIEGGQNYFIAYNTEKDPVAFASCTPCEHGTYKLNKLYIMPDQQGKGIGKEVIAFLLGEIKSLGANRLTLNVNIYNTSAIAFYTKIGFTKFKDEDIDIGGGYFMNDHVFEYITS